jgi:DNA (cytosine-5)-methyltransferase 1
MLTPQFVLPLAREIVIDLFAGGGGASTGIEAAIGRHVDIAINHNIEAVAMHLANHPQTKHFVSDVFEVDPVAVCEGRPVGMLWASPDCKHFSKAKGGKPVSKKIRGLAWVVVKWAKLVRPRVIFLENVEEFQTWGPLDANDMPCPRRKGRTFQRWKKSLENLGYVVSYQEDRACDLGTPTIRKRLFLVARCDGEPIVVPKHTHAAPNSLPVRQHKAKPYRTAAECIMWDQPAPSIFERTRELAEATKRRIAKGIMRYVVEAEEPFIVPLTHQGGDRVESISEPFKTITGANRGEKALIVPTLIGMGHGEAPGQEPRVPGLEKPLGTITAQGRHHGLVTAFLAEHANASNQRVMAADEPLRTQCAEVKGGHFSMVTVTAALLAQNNNHSGTIGHAGRPADEPVSTVTASGAQQSLVTATLVGAGGPTYSGKPKPVDAPMGTQTSENHTAMATAVLVGVGGRAGQSAPRSMDQPTATATAKYDTALLTAHLTKFRANSVGSAIDEPVHTVTANSFVKRAGGAAPIGLVTSNLIKLRGTSKQGQSVEQPLHTVSSQGTHHAEVRAFLIKYYGTDQDPRLEEPMHTVPTKDRFGLVMVKGQPYAIVDIGLRMLKPRELYRAQGFKDSYIIDWGIHPHTGEKMKLTATASIRMCGNSVCPPMAEAYVRANYTENICERELEAA